MGIVGARSHFSEVASPHLLHAIRVMTGESRLSILAYWLVFVRYPVATQGARVAASFRR